jgi:hypothetical protein
MGSLIVFDAHSLDPSIVCSSFLPPLFENLIFGRLDAISAISLAFVQAVGVHTSVLLLEKGRIVRFHTAPLAMPDGRSHFCCGQPMQYRGMVHKRRGNSQVKLRCRLRMEHKGATPATRLVECPSSISGVRSIIQKGGHRFFASYFSSAANALNAMWPDATPTLGSCEAHPMHTEPHGEGMSKRKAL